MNITSKPFLPLQLAKLCIFPSAPLRLKSIAGVLKSQIEIKTVLIEDQSKMPTFLRSGFRVLFFAAGLGSSLLMLAWFINQQLVDKKHNHHP
jgi:hypothetical protein